MKLLFLSSVYFSFQFLDVAVLVISPLSYWGGNCGVNYLHDWNILV
jgi:hypothetical protein